MKNLIMWHLCDYIHIHKLPLIVQWNKDLCNENKGYHSFVNFSIIGTLGKKNVNKIK